MLYIYESEVLRELRSLGVKTKPKNDSWLWRLIDRVYPRKSDTITVIGKTIWTSKNWDDINEKERVAILHHEKVHLEQMRRYTTIGFYFLYLFIPLPFCYSYFRTKFEREAYEISIRYRARDYGLDNMYREWLVSMFSDVTYGWSWINRKDNEAWYDNFVKTL